MQYIFYFNGQQLDVYLANRNHIERLIDFPANANGYTRFSDFLGQQTTAPCQLLVDLIEEEFREESLPHVKGTDQTILHKRHAAKLFRSTPFRHSQIIYREKSGRRDDHVLFSSLTNKDIIEPWLDIIKAHKLPLTGIHSLTVITPRLANIIDAKSPNVLIVTRQRGNNLRETFIKDNQVRFSRLAPQLDDDESTLGTVVNAEIEKTRRYLNTLKLLNFDEQLEVVFITDSKHLPSVRKLCTGTGQVHFSFYSTDEIANQLDIQNYPDSQYSDSLFVSLLCKKRNPNHYAQPEHLYHYRTHQTQTALKIIAGTLTATALLLSGINLADAFVLKHEIKTLQVAAEKMQSNLRQLTGAEQNATINPENILAAVKIYEALKERSAHPQPIMSAMGAALLQNPHLIVDKLDWGAQPPVAAVNPEVGIDGTQLSGTINNNTRSVIMAEGHIDNFNGSYLEANNDVNKFVSDLSALPESVRAEIIRYPIDTASSTAMTGKLQTSETPETVDFTVRVIMDKQHE